MPTRFAIWSAVSSAPQAAPDKTSLEDQKKKCRAIGASKGWVENAGPYVVPGESRTRFVNLRDAENAIPALKQLIQAAQDGEYDVLMLWSYDRLRDLIDPVAKTLSSYGVQIYSVSQPVEPIPPEEFNSYASDSESMIRGMSQIISRAQISDLRRKYKFGMPARIQAGLPKGKAPYGFRKPPGRETDRKVVPVQDLEKSSVVIQIKDWFLSGQSLWQIAKDLTAKGILTPAGHEKWSDVNVRLILKNRFYVGEVSFGKTRLITDPRTGVSTVVNNDPARIVTARGLHTPLWDAKTQRHIDEEFKKRGKKYTGIKRQRLSNLLYCGVCYARCWVEYPGGYSEERRAWACSVDPKHVRRKDSDVLAAFVAKFEETMKNYAEVPAPTPQDNAAAPNEKMVDLVNRRTRLIDAYEAGVLPIADYTTRVTDIDTQIRNTEAEINELHAAADKTVDRAEMIESIKRGLTINPEYISTAPAQEVNSKLRSLIRAIIIGKDDVAIKFIA